MSIRVTAKQLEAVESFMSEHIYNAVSIHDLTADSRYPLIGVQSAAGGPGFRVIEADGAVVDAKTAVGV